MRDTPLCQLEQQMTAHPDKATLAEYDALSTRFQTGGGYETDMQTDKICNGLGIPAAQRQQDFDSLSGGWRRTRSCCCSTSRRTTSICTRWNGSRAISKNSRGPS